MSDGESPSWPWTPGQYPDIPDRVRDNEERIRDNDKAISYVEGEIHSIRDLLSSARKGIWTLVIQAFVVILGSVVTYLLMEVV